MRRAGIVFVMCVAGAACSAADDVATEEPEVGVAEDAVQNGDLYSPTLYQVAKVLSSGGSCTGTVIDPWWVLTARHCISGDKDPNELTVKLDTETRNVTHVTLHPRHLEKVDVAMLRLDSPFTNITQNELPIWSGDTDYLIGKTALCLGYGGTGGPLKGGWFTIIEETVYGNPDQFYQLDQPNQSNQSLVPGDSGSSCRWSNYITGVHKGAGQVSAEAFYDWVIDRRDCPGFDPDSPSTGFCSEACPCDVGEGDCDFDAQCQPGLRCVLADVGHGLPPNYAVCDRIDPPTCGTFNPANPQTEFCRWSETEICACAHGEGDCDEDHDCGGSLECQEDSGFAVGLPSSHAICVYPAAPGCPSYDPAVDDAGFCSTACPCDLGQGHCSSDAECRGGLVCAPNVGAQFGKPASYDMCVRP